MASVGAVKRHNYNQARVRLAMTGEWEKRVKELKHDRDIWRKRAERAEARLAESVLVDGPVHNCPGDMAGEKESDSG